MVKTVKAVFVCGLSFIANGLNFAPPTKEAIQWTIFNEVDIKVI